MTSQIPYSDIDENFPVSYADNSAAGFRENFAIIKNSFITAADEITDLQESLIKLNQDNDGGTVQNVAVMGSISQITNTGADITINYAAAAYYTILSPTATNVTMVFSGAISNLYCKSRVSFNNSSASNIEVTITGTMVSQPSNVITVLPNTTVFFDAWTIDAGVTNYIAVIGEV